jgi:hypothetical protein
MAADWGTFITNVSDKLTSQSIQSYEEMADFLRKEYISATVGKAASPFSEVHVKGQDSVMFEGFKKGFKMLYEGGDLSFEEKKTSPEYADLDVQPPTIDVSGAADQVELDFRDWANENKATIPPFVYSQFFSQYPNFPADRTQAALEIARKILHQFDGTSSYIQWMMALRTGAYSDWGNLIMDDVLGIINTAVGSELKPGDLVRGFAKYKNIDRITVASKTENGNATYVVVPDNYYSYQSNVTTKSGSEVFNYIKGDTNIDNTLSYSDTYEERKSKRNHDGVWEGDMLEGKIVSTKNIKGSTSIKISFYDKQYNKNFIKELIPSTVSKKISLKDLVGNIPSVNITEELFQDQHLSNPNKIPDYLTSDFIRHFTYSKKYDGGYLKEWLSRWLSDSTIKDVLGSFESSYTYANDLNGILSNGIAGTSFYRNNARLFSNSNYSGGSIINSFGDTLSWIRQRRDYNKSAEYNAEETRFRELKIRWINELAEAARKNSDPDKPEDPYNVMAKGVLDYWKSCAQQPLSNEPGAPPCLFSPPQGGLYVPIYYGSQTMLGSNIKRAFNTGKRFNQPYEKQVAAKMVASALAFSFSMHLLELKFIYRGGIPGPNGPIPMIGFIPLVY